MEENWYDWNEKSKAVINLREDTQKRYEELMKKSDIVRFAKRSGESFWATEVNQNFGVCDDCRVCQKENIKYVAGYKIVGS
jgi:hypothetical protein